VVGSGRAGVADVGGCSSAIAPMATFSSPLEWCKAKIPVIWFARVDVVLQVVLLSLSRAHSQQHSRVMFGHTHLVYRD